MSVPTGPGDGPSSRPAPVRRVSGRHEERRAHRSRRLGTGTLACPRCDAPVLPGAAPMAPTDALSCPFCRREGAAREFLSLAAPPRPVRVEVRVVLR